jgi:hypothetical protein
MRTVSLIALGSLATLTAAPALAIGRFADVTIVDRDSSRVLPTHFHRGEWWVEGHPGTRYGIQVRSQDDRRLLAVTSVDGVNVLSGETAGVDQRGYVFDPYVGYDIAGWRKSDTRIAAFTFTSVPRSYAARTGRPDHVGVIGVALFREKPVPVVQELAAPPLAPADAPASPAREESSASADRAGGLAAAESGASSARRAAPAAALGTGHGRSETSVVTRVAFERASSVPDEVIRIRYDSRDNLLARGVIRQVPGRQGPDAFPASARSGYVPDP